MSPDELNLILDFVHEWRLIHGGKPATKALLVGVMHALGAHVYEGRTASLVPTQEEEGKTSRDYSVDLLAEHDGVWVTGHRRPSGRWPRLPRSIHPSGVYSQRAAQSFKR